MRIDIFDQAVELAANRSIVLHDARQAEICLLYTSDAADEG